MNELILAVVGGGVAAAAVSGAIQVIMWLLNRRAAATDRNGDIKKGLCVLLYDRVKYLGRRFIRAGNISSEDLEDLMNMHRIYHDNLDGNGFLDNLMGQVKRLPIKD